MFSELYPLPVVIPPKINEAGKLETIPVATHTVGAFTTILPTF